MIWYVSFGCAGGGDSVSDVVRGEDGSALGRTQGMGSAALRIVAVLRPLRCDKYWVWVRWGAADGVMWFMCCRMVSDWCVGSGS